MAMSPAKKVLLVIGYFLSIIFLAIGIFVPAWMKFETRIKFNYSTKVMSVSIGLWRVSACMKDICKSVSMNKLIQALEDSSQSSAAKNAGTDLLKSFLPVQMLCVFGGLAVLVGVSLVLMYFKELRTGNGNKQMAINGVILNMISGILVISAVAIQAGRNQTFKDDVDAAMKIPEVRQVIEIEVLFPSAILVSGIGAVMIFVLGLIHGISLFVNSYDKSCLRATNTRNPYPFADYNRGANAAECYL